MSVGHAGGRRPVTCEEYGVETFCAKQNLDGRASDMNAVGDDFSGDIGLGEDSANHAWIAVRERAHGVVAVSYTHLDVYKRQRRSRLS